MIKFSFSVPAYVECDIAAVAVKKLRIKSIKDLVILKKSLDARDKRDIRYVYTVGFITDETKFALRNGATEYEREDLSLYSLVKGIKYTGARPIVVGMGPAGLFAALTLAKMGARPIVIERGKSVEERTADIGVFNKTLVLDPDSNVLFGEGGAGTFSDGKLGTGIGSKYVDTVLYELARHGAPEEITYLSKPHVGTDMLVVALRNIRQTLLDLGSEIHFSTAVKELIIKDGKVDGVRTDKGDFYSDRVYLAIGHSARDTFTMLYGESVDMTSKVFSMGVRIEHLQEDIDFAQYGQQRGILPPADYKSSVDTSVGKLYTFCMCPGGYVINSASEEGGVCTNGMSYYARDGRNANSALLTNVDASDYGEGVLAGMEYQRKIERLAYKLSGSYKPLCQTFADFTEGKITGYGSVAPTVLTGVNNVDLNALLPTKIVTALKEGVPLIGRRIKGFDTGSALLTGPETRSSSPVRILRDDNYSASVKGLFPLGEGAGYAGGITSAAVDGIKGVLSSQSV